MSIELLPLEDMSDQAWDELLFQMPDWRIFQTSAWLRFIEATQGAKLLRLGVYDAGQLVGCWAAGKLHKGGLRIIGSPMRGWNTPYMGAASHDLPAMELLKAWRRFLENHHIHHAQVTHPRFTHDMGVAVGFRTVQHGTFVCPIPPTEEGILKQFHQSCREATRRARRRGVEVENTDAPTFIDHFYYQLEDVFGKQGMHPTFSKARMATLWRIMKPTGRLLTFWAKLHGNVIATGIYLVGNHWLLSINSSSLRSAQKSYPNELIRLEAMKMGADRGCSFHDLGGRGDYKMKFGTHFEGYHDLLYFTRPWIAWARAAYGTIKLMQLRRGLRKEVMPPRPPLPVEHSFEE
jgi:Acetyltransferase (GNAT) domain